MPWGRSKICCKGYPAQSFVAGNFRDPIFTEPFMEDIVWERLTEKRKRKLTGKMRALSKKCAGID